MAILLVLSFIAQPKPIVVESHKLWNIYDDNPIRAAREYDGKLIQFKSSVTIHQSNDGKHYLGVCCLATNRVRPPNIVCFLSEDSIPVAASLEPDQVVVITGTVKGREPSGAYNGFHVVIEKCKVEIPKAKKRRK